MDFNTHLRQRNIPLIPRLRENKHVVLEGYDRWIIADIAPCLGNGERIILECWRLPMQSAGEGSPPLQIVAARLLFHSEGTFDGFDHRRPPPP
jgi:hypothetical protein